MPARQARITLIIGCLASARRLFTLAILSALLSGPSIPAQQPSAEVQARLKERDELWKKTGELYRGGKLEEAIAVIQKVLVIERAQFGNVHMDVAFSLDLLGSLHERRGDFAAARPVRAEVLAIMSKLLGERHWRATDARLALADVELNLKMTADQQGQRQQAAKLHQQAAKLYEEGKYRDAIAVANQVLTIRKTLLGEQHPDTATSLNNLAVFSMEQGDHAKAEPLMRQALAIRKAVLGEQHPTYALSLNNFAELYDAQGEYAKAEPLYRQALEIRKAELGEQHPDYAFSLNSLAVLYQKQAEYAKAEPLLRQALEIRKATHGEKHPDSARSLNNLAMLYYALGDYARSEPLLRQVLDIRKEVLGENNPDYANSLHNLAALYEARNDYARAEALYRQALEIYKVMLGENHPAYASTLNSLGYLYDAQGDHARAEALYRQAMEIRKAVLGDKHPSFADSLSNLAVLYQDQGDYPKAEAFFRQALQIRQATLGEKHPRYAASLHNLASLHDAQGEYAKAEPLYRQALKILKQTLGEQHPEVATSVNNLAMVYQSLGDPARAEPLIRQAVAIRKAALGANHPDYARSLNNLAFWHSLQGDHVRAEPLYREALRITQASVELAASGQSERQQLEMARSVRYYLNGYLSFVIQARKSGRDAYDFILPWKGAIFLRQVQAQLDRADPQVAPLTKELQSVASQLGTLALATPRPERASWQQQVTDLTEKKEQLEAELARRSSAFRQQRERRQMTSADIQKALPAGTVLVDYLEFTFAVPHPDKKDQFQVDRHLAAFVVRSDQPVALLDLGPVAPIAQAIEKWRASIKRSGNSEPASEVRRLVWQPLAKHLAGAKLLLISPDGAVASLPFAALPGQDASKYLIEEMSLAVVPAPQMIPELLAVQPESRKPSLLLVGGIDFGAEGSLAAESGTRAAPMGSQRTQWGYLKGTADEIDALAKLFAKHQAAGEVTVLRGGAATEQALRQSAGQQRILHLATHGFFAPPEVKSALATDPKRPNDPGRVGIGRHPGLLSGLVLTGANREPRPDRDDGILTAIEVASLDLRQVDLAVLSACETGLGQSAGGEGILGLQRAFQAAGAKSVIASLWQVPDQPTQVLMERFYLNLWEKKLSRQEALREAQLWMLREGKSHPGVQRGLTLLDVPAPDDSGRLPPYYWAAFSLSGDWR